MTRPVPPSDLPPVAIAPIPTARFTLRPLRSSDVGLVAHYAADKRVAEMTTSLPHPMPPGAAEAFVARVTATGSDEVVWAMDATASGLSELVGVISLKRMDRNQSEVHYWVAPVAWNTGLASEAVTALVAANPLGNATMFASVFQDNPASGRVLTNAGFDYIGDAEAFCVARGAKVSTWTYIRKMAPA
jgi:RimJ/RimL family protein N-acetyltransferase